MADNRHECPRDPMAGTVNHCNKLPVAIIIHPVEITTHNIFGHEQDKSFLKSVLLWQHRSLDPFGIAYTRSNIPVFLLNLHAFLNNLGSSLLDLFLKNYFFLSQILFPDLYINDNNYYNENK